MNVWHLVFRVDSLTYTIAKALSVGGHRILVWVVDREQRHGPSEAICNRLLDTPGVALAKRGLPPTLDRLIVQVFPRPDASLRDVPLLAGRARDITLVTAGDRSRSRRAALAMQWAELRALGRHIGKVDRIVYKDGFHKRDLFGLFKSRWPLGFDVHSQFLHDETLFRAMHTQDWDPDAHRPVLANFMGCQDPDIRKRILDTVRLRFCTSDDTRVGPRGKLMFWHEYTDAAPVGLDPKEFVRILSDSDFSLCPRGYSLVTHRPIEALLRGSIPVLSERELDLYGVELIDGENCLAVRADRWADTLDRIERTEERQVAQMRRSIRTLIERHLRYDRLAGELRMRLGVGQ